MVPAAWAPSFVWVISGAVQQTDDRVEAIDERVGDLEVQTLRDGVAQVGVEAGCIFEQFIARAGVVGAPSEFFYRGYEVMQVMWNLDANVIVLSVR
jgi:hypothetical protein